MSDYVIIIAYIFNFCKGFLTKNHGNNTATVELRLYITVAPLMRAQARLWQFPLHWINRVFHRFSQNAP